MKTFVKTATTLAALFAIAGAANTAHADGTIPSGPYETVCDKNPTACGSDYDLPPRPKPKPPKPAKPTNYTVIWDGLSTSFTPFSVFK